MTYDNSYPRSSRTGKPTNPGLRCRCSDTVLGKQGLVVNPYGSEHAAKAARGAVHMEFGRHARALDQADFEDRKPWEIPALAPEAGLAE